MREIDVVKEHISESAPATQALKKMSNVVLLSVGSAVISGVVAVLPDLQLIAASALPTWLAPLAVAGLSAIIGTLGAAAKSKTQEAVAVALYTKSPIEKLKD